MPFLEMRRITKRFGDLVANDGISLDVERREVHTLLGENGAGKTTLMNILYGLYTPDEGEIHLDGKKAHILSPHRAIELHIGMIHQHFMLIPRLSVTENIVLGIPSSRPPLLSLRQAQREVEELSQRYKLRIDPSARVHQLPVGLQQRVEILKALYRKTDLLILDEPTAVLTPLEVETLFKTIRRLTQEGLAVIFISHKLNEVMAISDRVTVLRQGRVVGTVEKQETSRNQLASMMVGREMSLVIQKPPMKRGKKILELRNLSTLGEHDGIEVVRSVSLEIHEGEVLGIAGVDGNGQDELAELIAGLRPANRGHVLINGVDVTDLPARERIKMKLAYIPSDRQRVGLIMDLSVAENLILKGFRAPPLSKRLLLNAKNILDHAGRLIREFDIKVRDERTRTASLSGGNQQKVILAREISARPDILVAMQPTRGLDVASTNFVHRSILDHRSRGGATLFISTELDEIIAISDRIAVMYEGQIMGIVPGGEKADLSRLSLMMAGVHQSQPESVAA